jgi:hypothetical protein
LFHQTHQTPVGMLFAARHTGVARRLCRFWSATLEIRQNHGLATDDRGPAGLVGFGTLFAFRVRREESMMLQTFGDAYAARTKRIIPGVF